jgi:hypothetical protein
MNFIKDLILTLNYIHQGVRTQLIEVKKKKKSKLGSFILSKRL